MTVKPTAIGANSWSAVSSPTEGVATAVNGGDLSTPGNDSFVTFVLASAPTIGGSWQMRVTWDAFDAPFVPAEVYVMTFGLLHRGFPGGPVSALGKSLSYDLNQTASGNGGKLAYTELTAITGGMTIPVEGIYDFGEFMIDAAQLWFVPPLSPPPLRQLQRADGKLL